MRMASVPLIPASRPVPECGTITMDNSCWPSAIVPACCATELPSLPCGVLVTASGDHRTGTRCAADTLLGMPAEEGEARVVVESNDLAMAAQALLLARLPPADDSTLLAARLTAAAAAQHGPASVTQLCEKMDIGERRLQRLFANYAGVPPKWAIPRYRLQEAIWRLAQPDAPNLANLAQELGSFDQAHFSRSFAELVGSTPLAYRGWQVATGA